MSILQESVESLVDIVPKLFSTRTITGNIYRSENYYSVETG